MWCIHTVVLTQSQLERNPILFYRLDQTSTWLITNLIAICAFVRHIVTSLSVDEILLPSYMNLSIYFKRPKTEWKISRSRLHSIYFPLDLLAINTNQRAGCINIFLFLITAAIFASISFTSVTTFQFSRLLLDWRLVSNFFFSFTDLCISHMCCCA